MGIGIGLNPHYSYNNIDLIIKGIYNIYKKIQKIRIIIIKMNEKSDNLIIPLCIGIDNDNNNIISTNNNKCKQLKRIIIAYDFKENGYYISDTELENCEYKEFLLNTLHSYNSKTLFKFDSPYKLNSSENIFFCSCDYYFSHINICIICFNSFLFI